jgi:MFS superfamily sulfate permease-like transporter
MLLHLVHGAPVTSLFRLHHEEESVHRGAVRVSVKHAAIFPTWLALRRKLHEYLDKHPSVELDLSQTRLVDHTVISRLQELQTDLSEQNKALTISGLDEHQPLSNHKAAARKKLVAAQPSDLPSSR